MTLAVLGKGTALSLSFNALLYCVYYWLADVTVGNFIPLLILGIVMVIASGLVLTNFRWAPAAAGLVALITGVVTFLAPGSLATLAHPGTDRFFPILLTILACDIVALGLGLGATLQNYRGGERTALRQLTTRLATIVGLVLGSLLPATIVAANPPSANGSLAPVSTDPNGIATVHMAGANFRQNAILVPTGSKLTLVDDDKEPHVIANGRWTTDGKAETTRESGAPDVQNVSITRGSLPIGPFTIPGVYHLYCPVHRNMNLAVLVQ